VQLGEGVSHRSSTRASLRKYFTQALYTIIRVWMGNALRTSDEKQKLAQGARGSRAHPSILRPFSRICSGGRVVPEIEGLRFVAILLVVVYHLGISLEDRNAQSFDRALASAPVEAIIRSGNFGVQMFFVVSGFVLALPFASHHLYGSKAVDLRSYFRRRVTRLEPPYIISLTLAFLILVVVHHEPSGELFPHLLASLGYSHSLIFGQHSSINNVAWSLEVEIQFYLVVPWVTKIFAVRQSCRRRVIVAACIFGSAIVGPLLADLSPRLDDTILRFAQYFLTGFLLADLFLCNQLRPDRRRNVLWDGVAIIALALGVLLCTGCDLLSEGIIPSWLTEAAPGVFLPWLCFISYVAVFRGIILNKILTFPLFTTIGGMCYSMYLLHNLLLNHTLGATQNMAPFEGYLPNILLQASIMFPVIVAVAGAFFVLIERPCMDRNWPAKLWTRLHVTRFNGQYRPAARQVTARSVVENDGGPPTLNESGSASGRQGELDDQTFNDRMVDVGGHVRRKT
jgi:peptidoglycan/LPS O-acetylase OafA/YrhL